MSEHENLTGSFGRDYTGRMSESGVGLLERTTPRPIPDQPLSEALRQARSLSPEEREASEGPKPWESSFMNHSKADQWLEEREKKILRETAEEPLRIPKHVLRKETSWERFGWKEDRKNERGEVTEEGDRTKVRKRLEERLELDKVLGLNKHDHHEAERLEAAYNNLLDILLTSGKTPEQILKAFETDDGINIYRDRKDLKKEFRVEGSNRIASSKHEADAQAEYITLLTGNERTIDWLQKFVYTEANRDQLYQEYRMKTPENLYELAWQISFSDKEHEENFGVNGKYPILEMRVDTGADGKVEGGRYVVNQANFIRWMRERIMHWQDQEPDEYVDYFSKVQLEKEYRPLSLGEIIHNHNKYFTDETGAPFEALAKQALLEPWMLLEIRKYHIIYKSSMSSDKKLIEQMGEMFSKNKLTKQSLSKNMVYYLSTLSLDFGDKDTDRTLGGAWNTMFLAYYNFADFNNLKNVLGSDSSFFTRKGMEKAMEKIMQKRLGNTNTLSESMGTLLGKDGLKSFEDAFTVKDKDGKVVEKVDHVVDKKAFTKLVNYLGVMAPNANLKKVIDTALENAVAEQYDFHSKEGRTDSIDTFSLSLAGLIADAHTLFTGAGAKNDPDAAGFNALSKMAINFQNYRRKMATEARGNAMGNPFTVGQFKMIGVDWVRATRVAEAEKKDGPYGKSRTKTVLEVMEELRAVDVTHGEKRKKLQSELKEIKASAGPDSQAVLEKQREIDALDSIISTAYNRVAGQFEFKENAMVNYVANHIDRTRQVAEQIMGAKQIDFEKLAKYDPITKTMSFDRGAFQEQIQEKWNKQLRYMIGTYGELNFAMPVRASVFKGRDGDKDKWEYETIPLGEAMFGYEMLNIPQFRMCERDKDGKEIEGKWMIRDGRYVIDYNKVDADKTLVWKQFSLMKIGADLWSHIDAHSKDPKYSIGYFRKVLEAIEQIPAEILGDEYNMKDTTVGKYLFDKDQMRWLKNLTKTTNFRMLLRGLRNDQKAKVDGGGWSDSAAIFINAIFRGY
jgi:hypothetical protein